MSQSVSRDQYTALPLVEVLVMKYGLYRLYVNIINDQFYQFYQYYQSQASVGFSHFHIGCVFIEYSLFNTANLIQNLINMFWYKLTQFYIYF